jgi:transcription initiation factor IIE alpha subunit
MILDKRETAKAKDRFLHCPACAAALQQTQQFFDPKQDKTIRLFKCERCGERIWDD